MFRKLEAEYKKYSLVINFKKTEYMVVAEDIKSDLDVGNKRIKNCASLKYLGVTFSDTGKSDADLSNKIGRGKLVIRQLNSLLWSDKVIRITKKVIYKIIK